MPTLGNIIRRLRDDIGWTQAKLGEKLGVAESTISLYESDKREPDVATIKRLADIFYVSTDYLLGQSENKPLFVRENLPPEALDRIEEFTEFMRIKYCNKK